MRLITKDNIHVYNDFISVDGIGTIGLYVNDTKDIRLDYGMNFIVGTNKPIPCIKSEIPDKILELFNTANK